MGVANIQCYTFNDLTKMVHPLAEIYKQTLPAISNQLLQNQYSSRQLNLTQLPKFYGSGVQGVVAQIQFLSPGMQDIINSFNELEPTLKAIQDIPDKNWVEFQEKIPLSENVSNNLGQFENQSLTKKTLDSLIVVRNNIPSTFTVENISALLSALSFIYGVTEDLALKYSILKAGEFLCALLLIVMFFPKED